MNKFRLKLYITGHTPRSERAVVDLRRICEEEFACQYKLIVIDVLKHPKVAKDEKILATPTLIKELPPPLRRIIGDLSDKEKVFVGLHILPIAGTKSNETP